MRSSISAKISDKTTFMMKKVAPHRQDLHGSRESYVLPKGLPEGMTLKRIFPMTPISSNEKCSS